MPLLDHFRDPIAQRLQWISFHFAWCSNLAFDLNRRLPRGYTARPNAVFGLEIDVAALTAPRPAGPDAVPWSPEPPTATLPLPVGTDRIEVLVENRFADTPLAAAIELVSPANKDRPATRDAFVGKCVDYLNHGAGLLVVDIVTDRRANLHDDLASRLSSGVAAWGAELYAFACRPTSGEPPSDLGTKVRGAGYAEFWRKELAVGRPLPTMPLWLLNGPSVPVDLEAVYRQTLDGLGMSDFDPTAANGVAH